MKVVTWNVRGACSPHKKYLLRETLLCKQWVVLCAVEHKCHELAASIVHLRGYSSLYARHLNNHYLGAVLIVRDKYYPQVVHNYPYRRFLVLKITFFGRLCGWLAFMPLTKPLTVLHYGARSFKPYLWVVQD